MADRELTVRLRAQIDSYVQGMRRAGEATTQFGRELSGQGKSSREEIERIGKAALVMSTVLAGGLALSAKSAVDWESSFAGVSKTVDGTTAQMSALEQGLRNMAKELPATHGEIAAVAEAAGQLGVKVGDVEKFTKVMIDLGETTNLTADEAAVSIARLTNIMGTAPADVERLGSTLVDLGNNSASTESEILELGTRLAAAGEIAGLTEADVLAFASTLASVGIEAEAGGTALSKVFTSVRDAVLDGSDKLDTFAQVAGMTTTEFADAFRQDAAGAIAQFVAGLGNLSAAGQSTTGVFEELELTEERLMRALLSTASAGGLLTEQLAMGAAAWEDNNALQTEAEKRYATTGAQLEILRNKVADLGIDLGSALLPAINASVGAVGNLAEGFSALPGPVKTGAAAVTGLSTAVLGTVGIVGTLGPKVKEFSKALSGMGTAGAFASRNLGKITGIAGGVTLAIGAGVLAYEAATRASREYKEMVTELGREMELVITGQENLSAVVKDFVSGESEGWGSDRVAVLDAMDVKFSDIEQSIINGKDALDPFRQALDEAGIDLGRWDVGKLDEVHHMALEVADALGVDVDALKAVIGAMEDWDNGSQDSAEDQLRLYAAISDANEAKVDAAIAANTAADGSVNYAKAARDVGLANGGATAGIDAATDAMLGQVGAAEAAAAALAKVIDEYTAVTDPFYAMQDALESLEDAEASVGDAHRAHADAVRAVGDAQRDVARDIADAQQGVIDSSADVAEAQLDVADAMGIVADEAEAARKGIADLASEQQAAIDPLFAMVAAVQQLEDLKNQGRSSVKGTKTGDNSGKLETQDGEAPSALEFAEAAMGVQQAATRLAGAIRTGDVSLADSRKTLALWVKQGLLTKAQADEVGKAFELAATRADRLQGANVDNAAATAIAEANMEAAQERAEAVAEAQKRLTDAMDGSAEAQDRLARAHEDGARKIEDARRREEEAADNVADAQERVERATRDVMTASILLAGTLANDGLGVYAAKRQIEEMGTALGWTRDQINAAKDRVDVLAEASRQYARPYVAEFDLDTTKAWLKLWQIQEALGSDKSAMPQIGPDGTFVEPNRWGNIYEYARGGISQAHVAKGTIHKYAEPATGGEAYIPRYGDVRRSMSVLQHAAGWLGAEVTRGGAGGFSDNRQAVIHNHYPAPEPASDSTGRSVRKAMLAMS